MIMFVVCLLLVILLNVNCFPWKKPSTIEKGCFQCIQGVEKDDICYGIEFDWATLEGENASSYAFYASMKIQAFYL